MGLEDCASARRADQDCRPRTTPWSFANGQHLTRAAADESRFSSANGRARFPGLRYFAIANGGVDLTERLGEQMAHEREGSVERIILFSDGVLAIAITLLILPLTEIHPAEDATLADVVVENSAELGAFALSFAVIANYWTIHHDLFRPLRRHNGRIVLLNMFWLAAIVFLPLPTALIADGIDGGFAALYIGTLLAVSVLSLLIANYLARHPELTDGEAAAESRQHVVASAFSVGAILTALIISLFSPIIGLFALLLLFPAQLIAGRVNRVGAGQRPV